MAGRKSAPVFRLRRALGPRFQSTRFTLRKSNLFVRKRDGLQQAGGNWQVVRSALQAKCLTALNLARLVSHGTTECKFRRDKPDLMARACEAKTLTCKRQGKRQRRSHSERKEGHGKPRGVRHRL